MPTTFAQPTLLKYMIITILLVYTKANFYAKFSWLTNIDFITGPYTLIHVLGNSFGINVCLIDVVLEAKFCN